MIKRKNRSLSKIFFNNTVGVSLLLGSLVAVVFIGLEAREFSKDAELAREKGLAEKKLLVKTEVEKVIDYIHFTRLFTESKMRNELKLRTYEAWNIINHIYTQNKDTHSNSQIISMIKQALRSVRFNNGRGYYFMVSLDGTELLYPVNPDLEGQNLLKMKDARGNFVIRDEINLVVAQGETYVKGYWKKPDADTSLTYAKTSFIKIFEPLKLYVGAGDYLSEVKKDVQQDVRQRILRSRFGQYGYVFVNTYDGTAVVIDSDKYKSGDNVWEITDPYGVKVIQEEWKAVNKPGGGYLYYHWVKPNSDEVAQKISFVKGVDEWQWMVGAGVYIDEIEKNISEQREVLYRRMMRKGVIGLVILVSVLFGVYYLAKINSIVIRKNFQTFIEKLTIAVKNGNLMQTDDYSIVDLKTAVDPVNEIIVNKTVAEKSLRENEIRFRTIFQNVPIMVWVFDKNMVNKYRNPEFDNFFGITKGQNLRLYSLLRFVKNTKSNKAAIDILKKASGVFVEVYLTTFLGERVQNWACFSVEHEEFILAAIDITPQHLQKSKLEASNQTKDKVLSVISHDLHGPFNSIIGFSKLLLDSKLKMPYDKQVRYLNHIYTSSKSMHTMLTNLLSWARTQSGNMKLYMSHADTYILVQEVIRTLMPLAEQKNIAINNHVEHGLMLYTDPSLLRIVIQNLVANGIKFTNDGGYIDISARVVNDGKIQIEVADSGTGMSLSVVKRINSGLKVESFRGTNNESGTGLGLLICIDFVNYLGGDFKVVSQEGHGSTFIIVLQAPQLDESTTKTVT